MSEHRNSTESSPLLDLNFLLSGRETKESFSRKFPFSYQADGVKSRGEAEVFGTVSDYSGVLQFEATFSVSYAAACDRCLKELERSLQFSLDRPVSKTLSEDEEDETVFAENDVIDLLALCEIGFCENLPFKHLCSDDCKGLCQFCGADLNEATCSCKAPPDPRLAGLAQFFHE